MVDGFTHGSAQLIQLLHGADAHGPLSTRHRREVDVGLIDALPDPLVLDRPAAFLRHALLVKLVVVERAVVGDQHQAGHAIVRRGPDRRHAHQEVAVAHDAHDHALAVLLRIA